MNSPLDGGSTRTSDLPWRFRAAACLVPAVILVVVAAVLPGVARAEPSMADLDTAQERLAELERDFQLAAEEYNAAREHLDRVTDDIEAAQADIAERRRQMQSRRRAVGAIAARLYKGGSVETLDALLTAGEIAEAARRIDYLSLSQRSQQQAFERLHAERALLARELAQLGATRREAAEVRTRLAGMADALERKVAAQRDDIAQLREAIERARRAREERARREAEARRQAEARRRAEERSSRARAAAAAAAPAPATAGEAVPAAEAGPEPAPASEPEPDPAPAPEPAASAPSVPPASGSNAAVQAALAKVGQPYQWGGSGPISFDCSGLTQWAWAKAGVSLPHNSRMQYAGTSRVARSDIQPGDLLFFGSPIHHVGMYIGSGQMVEAPYSGAQVRVRSIDRSDYVGAGRPG